MSPRSDGIQNDLHQDEANAEALRSHKGLVGPFWGQEAVLVLISGMS